MFFTLFGYWAPEGGGASNKLIMQLFTLDSSKTEVFEIYSFDTVIT